uniref:Endo/exonuclease/phosphatase domain-containing protein n=1 Tax=Angiostrongylus cantonensis TaxID=6313 RepID=A0A158PAX2_ANGCA
MTLEKNCSSEHATVEAYAVSRSRQHEFSMSIDSFEQLTTRIGRLRLKKCGSTPALTIFVVYAPTSNYDKEEAEAFYMDLERFYREDHAFFKVIIGDFNAKIGQRRSSEERHNGTHGLEWNEEGERLSEFIMATKTIHGNSQFQKAHRQRWTWESPNGEYHNECWEDAVVDNIDEGYDRLIQHLHFSAMKAESSKVTKKRLSSETLELMRQRGLARAAGNRELTSELAKQCRQAIKEDLKERRAAVMVEAAEAGKSIRKARRSFADCKTKMIALRRLDGTITASRKAMEKIIHDYYLDLFDSHVHLPSYKIKEDGYAVPPVLPSEIRHAISSVKSRTAPGPKRIRSKHLKNLPPVLVSTLARLFTRYLSECKVTAQKKTSKTVLLFKKGDLHDMNIAHLIVTLFYIPKEILHNYTIAWYCGDIADLTEEFLDNRQQPDWAIVADIVDVTLGEQ